jgi:hypothetical protein
MEILNGFRYRFDSELAMMWGQKIAIVAAIIVVTWFIAKMAKWAIARLVNKVSLLQRVDGSGDSIGTSLGKIVSLLIWLFGIIAVLQQLNLTNVIEPLQTLLNNIAGTVPNIIGAGVIFFVGLIIARIVKQLVETALKAVDLDRWAAKGGVSEATGSSQLASTLSTVVFAFIIIPVAIAALQTLGISAISDPASQMLQMIFEAIPLVLGAAILLGIAFFIARWVGGLIETILPNLGVDRAVQSIGLLPATIVPSRIIAMVVVTALMMFAGIAATHILKFPELSAILDQVLTLGGRVIFGSVVIAAGVMIANLVGGLVSSSTGGRGLVGTMVRYLIVGVSIFMGLSYMQIGEQIVTIAFSGFVFASSVAAAIAFGLGGREPARQLLEDMRSDAKKDGGK